MAHLHLWSHRPISFRQNVRRQAMATVVSVDLGYGAINLYPNGLNSHLTQGDFRAAETGETN
jgi:hypothetical protein